MNDKSNDELKEILALCEKQCQEYLDGWKRAKADFINYQKDEARRFEELFKYGQAELIKELIGVLDSFNLANDLPKGVELIRQQIEDILKKYGVEKINISGQLFDPNFHEVIGEIESSEPPNTVIEEAVKGYTLNGRVVRPAKVKVAKLKQ